MPIIFHGVKGQLRSTYLGYWMLLDLQIVNIDSSWLVDNCCHFLWRSIGQRSGEVIRDHNYYFFDNTCCPIFLYSMPWPIHRTGWHLAWILIISVILCTIVGIDNLNLVIRTGSPVKTGRKVCTVSFESLWDCLCYLELSFPIFTYVVWKIVGLL